MMAEHSGPGSAEGDNKASLRALFLVVFVSLVGFGIVLPVFPFFGRLVGASPTEITLAMACYSLGQFIGAPVWGSFSDRFGRRPILIWSLVGSIAAYLVMAVAQDIVTLAASRLFGGLMAGNIAAAFAYVGDITDSRTRPKAMGFLAAAFALGFIFGPAIGGLLAGGNPDPHDMLVVSLVAAAITAVAGVATFFSLPESLGADRRAQAKPGSDKVTTRAVLARKPVLWVLIVLVMLVIGSAAMMESTFAFYAADRFSWGPMDVGLSFGIVGLVAAALQAGATAPLVRLFGEGRVIAFSILLYAAGLTAMAIAPTSLTMAAALALTAAGVGLFNPSFQSMTSGYTGDDDRGLIMGLTQGGSSLGRVIGPAVSGGLYDGIGMTAPYLIGAGIMCLAFLLALIAARSAPATDSQTIKDTPA